MVEVSILEYGVFGFLAYSSVLMLIISTIKDIPTTKSMSIARSLYMLFGVIAACVVMGMGPEIVLPAGGSESTYVINGTTGAFITNSTTTAEPVTISILNLPAWMVTHGLMGVILVFYVMQQFVFLFFKTDT